MSIDLAPPLTIGGRAVITSFVYPPIPIRAFDWCAYLDGLEEDGPYGWGATKDEAIADLREQIEADDE